MHDKLSVLRKRSQLKGSSIFIQDDLSPQVEQVQSQLRPVAHHLEFKYKDKQITLDDDKIKVNEKLYGLNDLHTLLLNLEEVGTMIYDDSVFFCVELTPLSNLFRCKLMIEGEEYHSVEQFYPEQKCLQHSKREQALKIMEVNNPREAMVLGKVVKEDNEWCRSSDKALLLKALKEKHDQTPQFRSSLSQHKIKKFAEVTMHSLYGVRCNMNQCRKGVRSAKSGENIMGQLLERIASQM